MPNKHLQWAQHFSKRAEVIDGVLIYRDELMDDPNHYRYVVPDDTEFPQHLLRAYHDPPVAMHRGREATYQSLAKDFYWRRMSKHVRNWVRRCPQCICFKTSDQHHGPMQVRVCKHPFLTLRIDCVGKLPLTLNGSKWILTAVCLYSNFLRRIPLPDQHCSLQSGMSPRLHKLNLSTLYYYCVFHYLVPFRRFWSHDTVPVMMERK